MRIFQEQKFASLSVASSYKSLVSSLLTSEGGELSARQALRLRVTRHLS
jgi:hypothetical protein